MTYASQGAVAGTTANAQSNLVGAVVGSGNGAVKATAVNKKALMKYYKDNKEALVQSFENQRQEALDNAKTEYDNVLSETKKLYDEAKEKDIEEVEKAWKENYQSNVEKYNELIELNKSNEAIYNSNIASINEAYDELTEQITNESGEGWENYKTAMKEANKETLDDWWTNNLSSYHSTYDSKLSTAKDYIKGHFDTETYSEIETALKNIENNESVSTKTIGLMKLFADNDTTVNRNTAKNMYSYLTNWNNLVSELDSIESQTITEWCEEQKSDYLTSIESKRQTSLDSATSNWNEWVTSYNDSIADFRSYFNNYNSNKSADISKINQNYANEYDKYVTEQTGYYNQGVSNIDESINTALDTTKDALNENYRNAMAYYGIQLPKNATLYGKNIRAKKVNKQKRPNLNSIKVKKITIKHVKYRKIKPSVKVQPKRLIKEQTEISKRINRLKGFKVIPLLRINAKKQVKTIKFKPRKHVVRINKLNKPLKKVNLKTVHTKTRGKPVYVPKIKPKVRPIKPVEAKKISVHRKTVRKVVSKSQHLRRY